MLFRSRFFFEKCWFEQPGFPELVSETWRSIERQGLAPRGGNAHVDPIATWHRLAAGLRQFLKGWGANLGREERDRKADLLSQIQRLDAQADSAGLNEEGWALRYFLEEQLTHLAKVEEAYWRQRGRQRWLLEGDANTAYFHAIANGRRRKCAIGSLVTDQGIITEQGALQEHIYTFYRNLMGAAGEPRPFTLAHNIWVGENCVSEEENNELMLTFTGEELDFVLASMKTDTAPGPDRKSVV